LHTSIFFNATSTTDIYTLSLHDALPISTRTHKADREYRPAARRTNLIQESTAAPLVRRLARPAPSGRAALVRKIAAVPPHHRERSEEHTSELQSRENLVCRLLLEKEKKQ